MNEQLPNRRRILMAALAVSLALSVSVPGADAENWFITPEEAAMAPAARTDSLQGGEHFAIGREDVEVGPIIQVENPTWAFRKTRPWKSW